MIDLSTDHLAIVRDTIKNHFPECEIRVFGSRISGNASTYSDLDIAIKGEAELDWQQIEKLRDDLSESDLPIMVDLLDWHTISDRFRQVIEEGYEILPL